MSKKDFQNGFALGLASGGIIEVEDTTEIDNLEEIIDNSGVLEDTEGSVSEKVEKVLHIADLFYQSTSVIFAGNTEIERINVYIDNGGAQETTNMFSGTTNLKFIVGVNTSLRAQVKNMFSGSGIEVIQEPFDFSSITSWQNISAFNNARNLREVRFVPECLKAGIYFGSPYLSNDSMQSIVDGLSTTSIADVNFALSLENDFERFTAEQRNTITNVKGWTLVFK